MKGLFSFTILALVAYGACADVDCSAGSPDHQPHPTDCSKYYTCSNGIAIVQECQPGLWWSVQQDTCVLPANTDCDATSTTTTASPRTDNQCIPIEDPNVHVDYPHETNCNWYYRCKEGIPTLYKCYTLTEHFSPTKRVCISAKVAGCDSCPEVEDVTDVVRLPHETSCHLYYLCKAGVPNLYQCKENLHFSRSSRECMEQSAAKCTMFD